METVHTKKAFIFDADSTLLGIETLDTLIRLQLDSDNVHPSVRASVVREIEAITAKGMNGEIPFHASLTQRLQRCHIHRSTVQAMRALIPQHVTPGMEQVIADIQNAGHETAVLSGGFVNYLRRPLEMALGIPQYQVFANKFLFDADGYVRGVQRGNPLIQAQGKVHALADIRLQNPHIGPWYVIGDGTTDMETYTEGVADDFLGVGIHAVRENVRKTAPYFAMNIDQVRAWVADRL